MCLLKSIERPSGDTAGGRDFVEQEAFALLAEKRDDGADPPEPGALLVRPEH